MEPALKRSSCTFSLLSPLRRNTCAYLAQGKPGIQGSSLHRQQGAAETHLPRRGSGMGQPHPLRVAEATLGALCWAQVKLST